MVRDPVCGMEVDPDKSNWVAEYNGEDYNFCSESCQKAFIKDPAKYTEFRPMGHKHTGHDGRIGGCCGGGMGRGMLSYVHIAIMILLILLLFIQRP